MLKHVLFGTIATLALSSLASADAPPAPPSPPAELAQLDFFVGTWNCSGKAFATPMGPEHATTATVHAAKEVGGRWVRTNYDENKTAANPMPYHVVAHFGYDSAKKQFVNSCVDVFGGYCTTTSSGWNGDTMIFEGPVNGMPEPGSGRDTFTRKGANQLTHMGEMQGPDKKWIKTDEETCRKGK
ncbi:MAG TPA: DUF1579 family protein [Rudaea sp.]|nr:DUF1579 family protein [Rudaea sp.]